MTVSLLKEELHIGHFRIRGFVNNSCQQELQINALQQSFINEST
tara:strand:+ start:6678 stop:6809 length:132 start_codon:yes stop_codon:yes gene_type:complete